MNDKLRLHQERLKKAIDLETISATTALSLGVVRSIDQGRFDDLPPGVYARAYVRAFAAAVGVPADDALRGIEQLLPQVEDPLPALRELAPPSPGESLKAFLATQAVPLQAFVSGFTLRRAFASLVDAALLLAIGVVMVLLASWAGDTDVRVLLEEAGTALALMFAVPVLLYFVLLDAIGHCTVGASICGIAARTTTVLKIPSVTPRPAGAVCRT